MTAATFVTAPIPPGPGVTAFAVTKSDSTVFDPPTRKLWVGGVGNLAVLMNADTVPVTFTAVPAGTWMDISVTKVMSTNTTATNIVAVG